MTLLMLCGHQRSGTSLLHKLCNTHPDIALTFEFGNLNKFDQPYASYRRHIIDRCKLIRGKWRIRPIQSPVAILDNFWFGWRYVRAIQQSQSNIVDVGTVERGLKTMFPDAKVVGDKWPTYVFRLDRYAAIPHLKRIVIYRDPRDVANSTLHKVHTDWAGQPWTQRMNTAGKIAERWVTVMHSIERLADDLCAIRYEDMIDKPDSTFQTIGDYLGVDPKGFNVSSIRASSVGKYHGELPGEDIASIQAIAGTIMQRYGYDLDRTP